MAEEGLLVDVSKVAKAFFRQDSVGIKNAVTLGLQKSGDKILKDAKRFAPRKTGRLRGALAYRVSYKSQTGELWLISTDSTVDDYWLVREFGPGGGVIRGRPTLAFIPSFSPLFSKAGQVKASDVISNPGAFGFNSVIKRGHLLLGVKTPKGRPKGRRAGKYGKQYAPLFILTPEVNQPETPEGMYALKAMRANTNLVSKNIIAEIKKMLGDK